MLLLFAAAVTARFRRPRPPRPPPRPPPRIKFPPELALYTFVCLLSCWRRRVSDSADTSLLYNPGFVVLSLSRPQVAQMIYRDPAMVADALTKSMISCELYDLITHGFWRWKCIGQHGKAQLPLIAPPLQSRSDYSEKDLLDISKAEMRSFQVTVETS